MKTTVITLDNGSYAIYVNGKKAVQCLDPLTSYNELIKQLGLPTNVEVRAGSYLPAELEVSQNVAVSTVSSDSVEAEILAIDAMLNIKAPKMEMYAREIDTKVAVQNNGSDNYNKPVGAVLAPEVGDVVFIDDFDGLFSKIPGGRARVLYIDQPTEDGFTYDDDIYFTVEGFNNIFHNWKLLRNQQDTLADKFTKSIY